MTPTEFWLLLFAIVMTMLSLLASVLVATASNWWALMLWMVTCALVWGLVLYQDVKGMPVIRDYSETEHHGNRNG